MKMASQSSFTLHSLMQGILGASLLVNYNFFLLSLKTSVRYRAVNVKLLGSNVPTLVVADMVGSK